MARTLLALNFLGDALRDAFDASTEIEGSAKSFQIRRPSGLHMLA
jgi:hypothetical protein